MAFRPCIDLKDGRVVQIVGGSLSADGVAVVNHVSERPPVDFAALYRKDGLHGGHVIKLGAGNDDAAAATLAAYPAGLQIGGGIDPDNAVSWLDRGASHVIVTSYVFPDGSFSFERLMAMERAVGRSRLVLDLSCRKTASGEYRIATDRWQTITDVQLGRDTVGMFEEHCAELLVHAADVEGRCQGIDEELVRLLGDWVSVPTTYAGGARSLSDIALVDELSEGKLDLTIGSALDIFGGTLVKYVDAAKFGRR